MAPGSLAGALAYINWTVLLALTLGSFGVVILGRLSTDATRGYLLFTGVSSMAIGLLALLADLALPPPEGLAIANTPAFDQLRRALLAAYLLLGSGYVVALARGRRAPSLAAAALLGGVAAALTAAYGWGGSLAGAIPLAIQLLVLAAATGGALAAMILGHWYLVTPRLSERPLVLTARLLTGVIAVQLVLFAAWTATGSGAAGRPFGALLGSFALFVWLRLLVGLLFPLVISWMALRTASTRSMESATGLLYIDMAAIASGTIVAAGLYFGAGLLV
ncbi:MAG: hypothetical protein H0X16_01325 [Chloroflexi bacterium]|nr:hypothetical protein [Chloroflexota bacterium]